MGDQQCGNCRFWITDGSADDGLCRCNPPAVLVVAGEVQTRHPRRIAGGWCGQWRAMTPESFDDTAKTLALHVLTGDALAARMLADKVREA